MLPNGGFLDYHRDYRRGNNASFTAFMKIG